MTRDVVLEAKDVTISFGDKVILKDVNFEIYQGETVVFIGPSGSGKTVLLKALAGIISPTSGEIDIDHEDWKTLKEQKKHDIAAKVGMMFQYGGLFDQLSAEKNIEFPLREHTELSEEKIQTRVQEVLKQVNLLDAKDKIPSELSGGMQKRLGIARALCLHPKMMFCDDPVAGQDPMQSDQMLKLIQSYKINNDATVIMVSSKMPAAFAMADRIFMLIDKELIETGTPEQTKSHRDGRVRQFITGSLDGPLKIERL